jgi:hypothetical protein
MDFTVAFEVAHISLYFSGIEGVFVLPCCIHAWANGHLPPTVHNGQA